MPLSLQLGQFLVEVAGGEGQHAVGQLGVPVEGEDQGLVRPGQQVEMDRRPPDASVHALPAGDHLGGEDPGHGAAGGRTEGHGQPVERVITQRSPVSVSTQVIHSAVRFPLHAEGQNQVTGHGVGLGVTAASAACPMDRTVAGSESVDCTYRFNASCWEGVSTFDGKSSSITLGTRAMSCDFVVQQVEPVVGERGGHHRAGRGADQPVGPVDPDAVVEQGS